MRQRKIAPAIAATVLVLAACGDDGGSSEDTATTDEPPPVAETEGAVAAVSSDSELGTILVDADGMTLYAFTNDADGQSQCYEVCADAWPPALVGPEWDVGPELDRGIFNAHGRDDDTSQLVVGRWPLYRYAQDVVPGDIKGQGVGGVWFVVSAEDGTLIETEPGGAEATDADAVDVRIGTTDIGEVLTDAEGFTLYGFTEDRDGSPTCEGECSGTWPALSVEGEVRVVDELDADAFTTVPGVAGDIQVAAGGWPLYTFAGDTPGDVNGHASGGVWFAVGVDGSLVDADVPPPAAGDAGADEGSHDY